MGKTLSVYVIPIATIASMSIVATLTVRSWSSDLSVSVQTANAAQTAIKADLDETRTRQVEYAKRLDQTERETIAHGVVVSRVSTTTDAQVQAVNALALRLERIATTLEATVARLQHRRKGDTP